MQPWHDLVDDARWAPSPHNVQPWLLRARSASTAELLFDPGRLLPDTDPDGRFITVGLGCFVESLAVAAAARGLRLEVEDRERRLDPSRPDEPVARLTVAEGAVGDDLGAELLRARRTSRLPYDDRPVDEALLRDLTALAADHGHRLRWSNEPGLVREVLALNEQTLFHDMTDDLARNEVGGWLRFTERDAAARADGFSPSALGFPGPLLRAFFHAHRVFALPGAGWATRRLYRRTMRGTRTVAWLQGPFRQPADWLAAGRLLQRLWLTLTRAGVHLHPFGSVITNPRANARLHELVPVDAGAGTLWLVVRLGGSAVPPRSHRLPAERLLAGG